jgi:proteic killer suppression protein
MDYKVSWNKGVDKALAKVPSFIRDKFIAWAMVVERVGLTEVRKLSGYHDEPLKGTRKGQRSIRLNRAYRAIYIEHEDGKIHIVEVIEVSKHEY